MKFIRAKRVRYKKQPLVQVVCQVKFNTQLRLVAELPLAMQAVLQAQYPTLEMAEAPGLSAQSMGVSLSTKPAWRIYNFYEKSRKWVVSLTPDSLAISTESYEGWEDFEGRFAAALKSYIEIYKPAICTRIGLRYVDLISREDLGIGERPWSELIRGELLGPLGLHNDIPEGAVETMDQTSNVKLDNGRLTLRCSLGVKLATQRPAFAIDGDFYADEQGEVDAARILSTLRDFNVQAGGFFRWSITDDLHRLLEPTE